MKQKNHSSGKKRFKITGTGKVMHAKSCKNHLLKNKSNRQKDLGNDGILLSKTNVERVHQLIPNL